MTRARCGIEKGGGASGDDGTGKQGFFSCKAFDAVWPASSPFITAVGGTWLDAPATEGSSGKEHGWAYSGGGFSTAFAMPSWQNETVNAYLAAQGSALPSSKLWPRGGRAIPDVAAVGTHFQVESSGYTGDVTGTSASCPTFAGLVAVINDMLVAKGKAPVGFINPLLYRAKKVSTTRTGPRERSGAMPAVRCALCAVRCALFTMRVGVQD